MPKALRNDGRSAKVNFLVSMKICFLTIANLIGIARKLPTVMHISITETPNQIVQAATITLLIMLTNVILNAAFV